VAKDMERVAEEAADYGARVHAEERVILHGISWETFERILDEVGDNRGCRMAYDDGELEIMAPYFLHENSHLLIAQMVRILAEEMGLGLMSAGSVTCKRKDKSSGLEPDSSFYLKNAKHMRELFRKLTPAQRKKYRLDLTKEPPPDLMIEVDISRSSMSKISIYESLGVPEIWRFDGEALRIYQLDGNKYIESAGSATFGGLKVGVVIPELLEKAIIDDENEVLREFRAWVKKNKK
jgi:Uma2 family endonuclease